MDSATWALGLKTAIAGVTGVFVVMAFLQISTNLTSRIIKAIETRPAKDAEQRAQAE